MNFRIGVWDMSTLTRDLFVDGTEGEAAHAKYRQFIKSLPKSEHTVLVVYNPDCGVMQMPACFFRELPLKHEYRTNGVTLSKHPVKELDIAQLRQGMRVIDTNDAFQVILDVTPEYIMNPSTWKRLVDRLVQDIDGEHTSIEGQFTPVVTVVSEGNPTDKLTYTMLRLTDFTVAYTTVPHSALQEYLKAFHNRIYPFKVHNKSRAVRAATATGFKLLNTAGTPENIKKANESMDYISFIGDNWSPGKPINTYHQCVLNKYHGGSRLVTTLDEGIYEFVGVLPKRSSQKSAGYDFCMPYVWYNGRLYRAEYTLAPGGALEFKTGVTFNCKDNQYLKLLPRHSVAIKKRVRLTNTEAIIDADFAGYNIGVSLLCSSAIRSGAKFVSGERVIQGIIQRYDITDDDDAEGIRHGSSYFS